MIIEQIYFQHLLAGVKPINDSKNRVYLSEYYDHYSTNTCSNFTIKFPLQGNIHFKTQHGEFDLCPGFYLLSYQQKGITFIESKTPVRFICIDIEQECMHETFDRLSESHNMHGLNPDHFFSNYFFEHIYSMDGSDLGKCLTELANSILEGASINEDTFSQLAEKIVLSELANYTSIRNLNSIKTATKKETLKRLLKAKNYIDENYLKNPGIAEIAKSCNLSGFHFLRSFKQAFALSPYQYMLQKRLDYACTLLLEGGMPIWVIARKCSFSDPFTFSKAFKKYYALSPSEFKKNNFVMVSHC